MWSTPWRWIRLCCWSSSAPWCFSSRSSAVSGRFVTPPACWRRYDWSLISWSLSSDISSVQCYMLQFDWWVQPSSDCSGRLFGSCSFWGSWRPSSSCRSLRESWDISSLTRWHHTDDISRYKITSCSRLTLSVWMMLFLFRWWRGRRSWWWRPSSSTGRTRTWRTPSTSSRRRWRSSRVIRVWDDPVTEDHRARWCWTDGLLCFSFSAVEWRATRTGPTTSTSSVRTPTPVWRPVEFPSPAVCNYRTRSEPELHSAVLFHSKRNNHKHFSLVSGVLFPLQTVLNTMCGYGMQQLEERSARQDVFTVGCLEKIVSWAKNNLLLVAGLTGGLLLLEVTMEKQQYQHRFQKLCLQLHLELSSVFYQ